MEPEPGTFRRIGLVTEGALAVVAVLIALFMTPSPLELLRPTPVVVLQGLAATLPLLLVFYLAWKSSFRGFATIRNLLEQTLVPMLVKANTADLVLVSIAAGIGEELLFRGVIQLWLHDLVGVWVALIVASMLFGLAHAVTRTYIILTTLIGAYFGLLMIFTGSLVPAIISHALYDLVGLYFLRRHYRQRWQS